MLQRLGMLLHGPGSAGRPAGVGQAPATLLSLRRGMALCVSGCWSQLPFLATASSAHQAEALGFLKQRWRGKDVSSLPYGGDPQLISLWLMLERRKHGAGLQSTSRSDVSHPEGCCYLGCRAVETGQDVTHPSYPLCRHPCTTPAVPDTLLRRPC